MAKRKTAFNPFYVLLVVLGLVFSLTACAYGVMAFRAVSEASHHGVVAPGEAAVEPPESSQLLVFLDRYGMQLLAGELVLLAIASFAAMGTDSYWTRRAAEKCPAAEDLPQDGPADTKKQAAPDSGSPR